MVSIVIRTFVIYILLSLSLRLMGKRQIGELDIGELVSTLLISEIAAIPIDDPDIPLFNAIIPVLLLLSIEIILSTIKNKSERLKNALEGKPVYIIYKGRIIQKALNENRISINELLSEIRTQGIGDISEINYAIVEQNGSLSLLKKNDAEIAHTLIIDGAFIEETIKRLGYNREWVQKRLRERKAVYTDVFLMTITDGGEINLILKDGSF